MSEPRLWAVIPAAGRGDRFGAGRPKQYAVLRGRALIEWSLAPFLARADLAGIVIALAADDRDWPRCRPSDARVLE
ncbi:MAG: 2-C-methyl-D-erythritol 4-phosphate cytidylyltransferase, partial [Gammaproteobacteria bacterium]